MRPLPERRGEVPAAEVHSTRRAGRRAHRAHRSREPTVTAEHILIATGGRPNPHAALPGHELCIISNEAFDLPELPKAIVIAGGGYIAVEFANIFHGLGVETTLIYRGKEILQRFDNDLRRTCMRRWRRRASASSATRSSTRSRSAPTAGSRRPDNGEVAGRRPGHAGDRPHPQHRGSGAGGGRRRARQDRRDRRRRLLAHQRVDNI